MSLNDLVPPASDGPSPQFSDTRAAFIRESLTESEVVHVIGDVDIANKDEFEASIAAAAETGRPVLINLVKCLYIDSTGLNALWKAHSWLEARMHIVASTRGAVRKVFEITGLGEHLQVAYEETLAIEL